MIKKIQFSMAFALLLVCGKAQAQCPEGNQWGEVYLTTQAEVDAFAVNYPNCTEITGYLSIGEYENPTNITDLTPLSNLTSIESVGIYSTQVTSLSGLNNVTHIGDILIMENHQLTSLSGLENLTTISNDFSIYENQQLTSLTVFSNLTSLSSIQFNGNPLLTSLSGLESIISLEFLSIWNNNQLTDISALQNIDPATFFYGSGTNSIGIWDNPLLSVCNLPNICTYLQNGGEMFIENNAGDCISEQAVLNACSLSVNDNELSKIQAYPNPVKDILYFEKEVQKITITDLTGKVLVIQNNVNQTDMSALQSGVYFITIEQENGGKDIRKVVKK